jgi:hypothetical protein
MKVAVFSFE